MRFAIISAGEGSRLRQEGALLPKPLTVLNGTAMIDRLIGIFVRNGASSVAVIVNNESGQVKRHLEALQKQYPLEIIVKTTPSSMHSFYELSSLLRGDADDRFCLTTVDTIFREREFADFIEAFRQSEEDGYMAVTDYVDDEKPLFVSTDAALRITGFHDRMKEGCKYISGGIYCLRSASLDVLAECVSNGVSRMRNYQRELVGHGFRLKAYPFGKILDVDHVEDIAKAEAFLAEENG